MPCYNPLRGVVKSPQGISLSVPCGACIGCKLESSRQWAVRIMHESKMHDSSSFITLTFDDQFLPKDGSLSVKVCQLFMKRLRKVLFPVRIRFFLCGEYGERFGRPHYHAIIFGYGFPDKVRCGGSNDQPLFTSKILSDAWGFGFCSIGNVSFETSMYVANYATKKIKTNRGDEANRLGGRRSEFLLMSRRPGIGRSWIDRFRSDVYPSDEVITNGVQTRPPRYYDKVSLFKCYQSTWDLMKKREKASNELENYVLHSGVTVNVAPSRNARRLAVREAVARAKLSLKSRRIE